ncbi:MAG: hypothetical protein ACQEXC_00400 [Pseudomonadota bacterium]
MKLELNWVEKNYGETENRIYRDTAPFDDTSLPAPVGTVGQAVTTFEDTTVVDKTLYYYRIGAVYQGSVYLSDQWAWFVDSAFFPYSDDHPVVSNIAADGNEATGEITLTWAETSSPAVDSVIIYRSTTSLDPENLPAPLATVSGGVETYVDDDPAIDTQTIYYYLLDVVMKPGYKAGSNLQSQVLGAFSAILADLWASGEDGVWIDLSDSATTYQDQGRTTLAGLGEDIGGVTDKSGNGWPLYQPTSTRRPTVVELSGKRGAEFDGADGWLCDFQPGNKDQLTFAIAYRHTGTGTAYPAHSAGLEYLRASMSFAILSYASGNDERIVGGEENPTTTKRPNYTWVTMTFDRTTQTGVLRSDGVDEPFAIGTIKSNDILTLGYRTPSSPAVFLVGEMFAVIAVDRVCTTAELDMIDQYMAGLMP